MPTNSDNRRPSVCIIESPYAGANPVAFRRNIAYLHAAIQDCLKRGEVPYASHGFFPGALDDNYPDQRKQGLEAGFKMAESLMAGGAFRAIYNDRGISRGMNEGIAHADRIGMLYVPRSLGPTWDVELDGEWCSHHDHSENERGDVLCDGCGILFVEARLPQQALNVATDWLTKRA
jgi:hypothetical protein